MERKKIFRKMFDSVQNFLELQYLVDFLELSVLLMLLYRKYTI